MQIWNEDYIILNKYLAYWKLLILKKKHHFVEIGKGCSEEIVVVTILELTVNRKVYLIFILRFQLRSIFSVSTNANVF